MNRRISDAMLLRLPEGEQPSSLEQPRSLFFSLVSIRSTAKYAQRVGKSVSSEGNRVSGMEIEEWTEMWAQEELKYRLDSERLSEFLINRRCIKFTSPAGINLRVYKRIERIKRRLMLVTAAFGNEDTVGP